MRKKMRLYQLAMYVMALVMSLALFTTSCEEDPVEVEAPTITFDPVSYQINKGDSAALTVKLTGKSPWEFKISDGTKSTTYTAEASPSSFKVSPEETTTYTITSLADADENEGDLTQGTLAATVTVKDAADPATAGFSTSDTEINEGDSVMLSVDLTGTANWTLVIDNGTKETTYSDITSSPFTVYMKPSETSTYMLKSVSDANGEGMLAAGKESVTVTVNIVEKGVLLLNETFDYTNYLPITKGRLDIKAGNAAGEWCDWYVVHDGGTLVDGDSPSRHLKDSVDVELTTALEFTGYVSSGVGKSLVVKDYTGDKGIGVRSLDDSVVRSIDVAANEGVTYYAAMFKVNSFVFGSNRNIFLGLGFNDAGKTGNAKWPFRATLNNDGNTDDGETFNITIKKDGGADTKVRGDLKKGQTYLMVFKNENGADGKVTLSAKVFATGETLLETEPNDWTTVTDGDDIVVYGFGFYCAKTDKKLETNVGGMRAGTTWETTIFGND